MKRIIQGVSAVLTLFALAGCVDAANTGRAAITKEECTVEQFIALYGKPIQMVDSGMTKAESEKYNRVIDITPVNVYEEIGCKLFKINSTCETYIVYKNKIYPIGRGFGGWGITDVNTCDFDNDKQMDLLYTYSWGSGLHRSHIGIFNFTTMEETTLEYVHLNKDMMLEKLSGSEYKVFDAVIKPEEELDYCDLEMEKRELLLTIKSVDKQPVIMMNKNVATPRPEPSIGIPEGQQPPDIEVTAGGVNVNCVVGSKQWNGIVHTRDDIFQTIVYGNELPYFRKNEVFHIALDGAVPDSVVLYDDVLNEDGSLRYTRRETQIMPFELIENKGSFTLGTNPAALLSSNSADYEPGATIRGFRLKCTWGKNVCEYAFIIRTDP